MMQTPERTRITATQPAHRAIARLRAARGGRLIFIRPAGRCAGSTAMCFDEGEFALSDNDVLLGVIDGCRFYVDARLDEAWGRSQLTIDVEQGGPEGESLAAGPDLHFVVTSSDCMQSPLPAANGTKDPAPSIATNDRIGLDIADA
jgi:uncharacterized protein (DUF779 family)